ncbi:hypothetical protein LOTGIDRAFT_231571 [Lottia gigantea]|uniref:Prolyl 4-hydroxylase alpha subunit domain-containing protein n=1 Tax=Lottia gigantea TaxID=225164 RepID=V4ARG1_LOTGI|nr:hypothetical protein LOTGIDRAFT_231571 [Lottia gigantea]ESO97395.1 hypothetical protein LOTGIDRAFT_231571 [Lottia gigantea]
MTVLRHLIVCSVVLWHTRSVCGITSSLSKIRQLVLAEEAIIPIVKGYCDKAEQQVLTLKRDPKTSVYEINYEQSRLNWLQNIYKNIVLRVVGQTTEERLSDIYHPTSAVCTIKFYVTEFFQPLSKLLNFKDVTKLKATVELPQEEDLNEAYLSLVRLQAVYNFSSVDLYHGRVMNRSGHKLNIYDAVQIVNLVPDQHLEIGLTWIDVALTEEQTDNNSLLQFNLFRAASEIYFRAHRFEDGVKYLEKIALMNPNHQMVLDLLKLKNSYIDEEIMFPSDDAGPEYVQSCTQSTMVLGNKWYHVCRYQKHFLPYVLYKEEILHWQPYISVFYDVINDETIKTLKNHSVKKLAKSLTVGSGTRGVFGRTSSNTFLDDSANLLFLLLSQKIGELTHLNTHQNTEGISSAEAYQVVNYGIGGEYRPHVDASPDLVLNAIEELQQSGDRIATFLIYLSNVEYGGATVFPYLRIKMPPTKTFFPNALTPLYWLLN